MRPSGLVPDGYNRISRNKRSDTRYVSGVPIWSYQVVINLISYLSYSIIACEPVVNALGRRSKSAQHFGRALSSLASSGGWTRHFVVHKPNGELFDS